MPSARDSSLLIEKAAAKREQARRCRALAQDMGNSPAATFLNDYALDLEERAEHLELQAGTSESLPERDRRQA